MMFQCVLGSAEEKQPLAENTATLPSTQPLNEGKRNMRPNEAPEDTGPGLEHVVGKGR